ncbi:MAG: hypothetical protein KIT22_00395 [Verrucomicrobiae bacterium]|nr:hypothetical protein [Verrucomicrobiae bacterium]
MNKTILIGPSFGESVRARCRAVLLGSAGFLLLWSMPFCRAAGDVLTPHRVATLRSVAAAAISPDGARVAYTLSIPRQPGVDEDGEPWAELWVADAQEGAGRPFVTGKVNVSAVQWSADGRQIAFLAKRGEDRFKSLYFIPVDGGEARKAAELPADISAYSLAPDGLRAALVASEAEPEAKKKLKDQGFKQEIYEEDGRPARIWPATLRRATHFRALSRDMCIRCIGARWMIGCW